jgi:hypothetical protein
VGLGDKASSTSSLEVAITALETGMMSS